MRKGFVVLAAFRPEQCGVGKDLWGEATQPGQLERPPALYGNQVIGRDPLDL